MAPVALRKTARVFDRETIAMNFDTLSGALRSTGTRAEATQWRHGGLRLRTDSEEARTTPGEG